PAVAGAARAEVRLDRGDPHPRIGERREIVARAVTRGVIDNKQLEIDAVLREHARNRARQQRDPVVGRKHDRDAGAGHQIQALAAGASGLRSNSATATSSSSISGSARQPIPPRSKFRTRTSPPIPRRTCTAITSAILHTDRRVRLLVIYGPSGPEPKYGIEHSSVTDGIVCLGRTHRCFMPRSRPLKISGRGQHRPAPTAGVTMSKSVRRIVTGHDKDGTAVIISDGMKESITRAAGVSSALLWVTDETPADISGSKDQAERTIGVPPPMNGSILRIVDFPA